MELINGSPLVMAGLAMRHKALMEQPVHGGWCEQPTFKPGQKRPDTAMVWEWATPNALYVAVFTPEEECESMAAHFSGCGWTRKQINELDGFAWFSAAVGLWSVNVDSFPKTLLGAASGEPHLLDTQYLGACCYKDAAEFYIEHRGEYLLDMIGEALTEAGFGGTAPHRWVREQQQERWQAQQDAKETPCPKKT